jgi:hypothetical protein
MSEQMAIQSSAHSLPLSIYPPLPLPFSLHQSLSLSLSIYLSLSKSLSKLQIRLIFGEKV